MSALAPEPSRAVASCSPRREQAGFRAEGGEATRRSIDSPAATRDSGRGGLPPAAVILAGLVSKRHSPTPDHPGIERWYRRLEKRGFTPPAPRPR